MLNQVLNVLWEVRFLIIGAIGILYSFSVKENRGNIKSRIIIKIKQAEALVLCKTLNSRPEIESWIFDEVKIIVPPIYLSFISDDKLKKIIHELVEKTFDYLDDGKINSSI